MPISAADVEKIAHLARLELNSADTTIYSQQLSAILNFISEMNALDTESVLPLSHPFELKQRLRNDEVTEENLRIKFQQNAPLVEAGLYLVPKVIEEGC